MRCYGFQNETKDYLNRLERENGLSISGVSAKALNDRVEALKKSGVWTRYALGFNDVDGDAYLARANVTNVMGRGEVLWFVRGMKALGLYSNMVAWPMRSYQNVGTGSTVYSLGGLGIYNGTMINTVTWGSDGITNFGYSGASRISIPTVSLTSGGFTFLSSHYYVSDNNRIWDANVAGFGSIGLWANYAGQIYFDTRDVLNIINRLTGNGGILPTVFNFSECVATPSGSRFYRNGILKRSDVNNLNNIMSMTNFRIGQSATYPTLKIPFAALINIKDLTTTTYNLYKATLGDALGLP